MSAESPYSHLSTPSLVNTRTRTRVRACLCVCMAAKFGFNEVYTHLHEQVCLCKSPSTMWGGGWEEASEALVGNVACGTTEPSRLSCDAVRRDGYVSQACA